MKRKRFSVEQIVAASISRAIAGRNDLPDSSDSGP